MPATTSAYVDISTLSYAGQAVTGIDGVSITQRYKTLLVTDNNQMRPVASHRTSISETVTLRSKDLTSLLAVITAGVSTPANALIFTAVPAEQNSSSAGVSPARTVTVQNVVWEDTAHNFASHNEYGFTLTGIVIGLSGGGNPITIV